jgi:hypothetical protein
MLYFNDASLAPAKSHKLVNMKANYSKSEGPLQVINREKHLSLKPQREQKPL